ncbi:MarR family winged helix-turn-helix transcriptional regulator [Sulfuriroseicoccus oceanibius]|uniref:MarR family transcriptional regulator n=1 Tax=Sulfuriroseicoccus oceanibius TaxID=2707525 RepID=A0A6B3LBQ9_9BACT|nr:MarR family transcriptional regulator [Sulfuriroseicoccus oceanibius]QQL44653.1 MarR family transcriptional regulator [Sulfuriroseicoccus oceanibius]
MKPTSSETQDKTVAHDRAQSPASSVSRGEIDKLADFMMLAQRSCLLDLSSDLNEGKVSYAQFFLLGYLDEQESLTMTDIARKMGHSTAAATGLVDRLQKLKYVERVHAEDDRRKILVRITPKGSQLIQRLREGLVRGLSEMMAGMDEQGRDSLPFGEGGGRG